MKALHPHEDAYDPMPPLIQPKWTLSIEAVESLIDKMPRASAGGSTHIPNAHILGIMRTDDRHEIAKSMIAICKAMISGRILPVICHLLNYANGIAFAKEKYGVKDYGLRPITLLGSDARLRDLLIMKNAEAANVKAAEGPFVLARRKEGVETGTVILQTIERMMQLDPTMTAVSLDASNAFNSVNRAANQRLIAKHLPNLAYYHDNMYNHPILVKYSHRHSIHFTSGYVQGLTTSVLFYNTAKWQIEKNILRNCIQIDKSFDIALVAHYIDDGLLGMQLQHASNYLSHAEHEYKKYGIKINKSKSVIANITHDPVSISDNQDRFAGYNYNNVGDLTFLGAACGSEKHIMSHLNKRLNTTLNQLHHIRLLQNRQLQTALILRFFQYSKLSFDVKTLPKNNSHSRIYSTYLPRFQSVQNIINKMVTEGVDIHKTAHLQIQMKRQHGGFGLRQPQHIGSVSRAILIAHALPKIEAYLPALSTDTIWKQYQMNEDDPIAAVFTANAELNTFLADDDNIIDIEMKNDDGDEDEDNDDGLADIYMDDNDEKKSELIPPAANNQTNHNLPLNAIQNPTMPNHEQSNRSIELPQIRHPPDPSNPIQNTSNASIIIPHRTDDDIANLITSTQQRHAGLIQRGLDQLRDELKYHESKINEFVCPIATVNVHDKIRHKDLLNLIDKKLLQQYELLATPADTARLKSLAASGATSVLETSCQPGLGRQFTNEEWRLLISLLLGARVYPRHTSQKCRKCSSINDAYGVHAVNCAFGIHRFRLHNGLRYQVRQLAEMAGYRVEIEQKFNEDEYTSKCLSSEDRRLPKRLQDARIKAFRSIHGVPGDLKIYNLDGYAHITDADHPENYFLDLSVINILSPSYIAKAAETQLAGAKIRESEKRTKYAHHAAFIPLAIETYGGLGPSFKEILQILATRYQKKKKKNYSETIVSFKRKVFCSLFSHIIQCIMACQPIENAYDDSDIFQF